MMTNDRDGAWWLGSVALLAAACGGPPPDDARGEGPGRSRPPVVTAETANKFTAALDAFNAHEKARDWTPAACADVAGQFQSAAAGVPGGKLPAAIYDAGLAYQRCGNDKEAKARFTAGARR